MKLSKFVKRAKSESYCMVIHADDSGIWLGTRSALYNATELPEMEGKEQVGAVLDIDSKAWEKMFFDEKYAETGGAAFGMNLTDADPLEQEARRVPLEMFYKGMGLVGLKIWPRLLFVLNGGRGLFCYAERLTKAPQTAIFEWYCVLKLHRTAEADTGSADVGEEETQCEPIST